MRALHQTHSTGKYCHEILFQVIDMQQNSLPSFQSFTLDADGSTGPARLEELREQLKAEAITLFLVPHADEHQNEYLPARAERLAWLTGFTGSAGFAIVGLSECPVFVDGRYTLQVREQIDNSAFTPQDLIETPPSKWLENNTTEDDTIGYDPWLITVNQLEAYEKAAAKTGAKLKPVPNLIDRIWVDQPDAPLGPVAIHPVNLAGKPAEEKISDIAATTGEMNADLAILTDPASLAWLFNIRGSDVVHNPLALGFATVPVKGKPVLFMDNRKLDAEVTSHLENIADLAEPATLLERLTRNTKDRKFLCDPDRTPIAISDSISAAGGEIVRGRDPVVLPRAIKNATEIAGTRAAHVRDGVAMCSFLCWLDSQAAAHLDEISVAKKLETFRRENAEFMGSELKEISFDTISGFGPNGAIVHYRVTEASNRKFSSGSLYLNDSGGQYEDGTTDITRTISIGEPPASAVKDFTLVLKGHIALAKARFPKGTRGMDLDVLARNPLWQTGRDFAHGTGHGVGSYLNVHEGPQNISKRGVEPLVPGMIISNEPGFYVEGEYGIRIENLVLVKQAESIDGGNIETHAFETLTLCPIDRRLIDTNLLDGNERDWLNQYHALVFETISPHLSNAERQWLETATASL